MYSSGRLSRVPVPSELFLSRPVVERFSWVLDGKPTPHTQSIPVKGGASETGLMVCALFHPRSKGNCKIDVRSAAGLYVWEIISSWASKSTKIQREHSES